MNSIGNYRLTEACLIKLNPIILIREGIKMETEVSW